MSPTDTLTMPSERELSGVRTAPLEAADKLMSIFGFHRVAIVQGNVTYPAAFEGDK